MKKINRYLMTLVLAFGFVLFTGPADLAAESADEQVAQPVANVSIGAHGLTFQPKVEYAGLVLTVATPGGAVFSKTFNPGITPYFELSELDGNSLLDGSYTFELRVLPVTDKMVRTSEEAAGFENQGLLAEEALTQNGYFTVQGGNIVTMGAAQDGLAQPLDIVHVDDVIIQFSLCVGNDCVNGENFGFDTLRLKENNLRIHFDDTSNSASFPNNDWRITINDSSNGGANYFRVDDATNGKSPFTIEANAPSHSLYVDDGGRLGLGTSTPVVEVHIKDGDTPTLRLEQDGSSGFTPQTWDVAGNETNFFVRDVTNGSQLPFKIRPGADNNSLYIDSDNDIGLGTTSPDGRLDITVPSGYTAPALVINSDTNTLAALNIVRAGDSTAKFVAGGSAVQFGSVTDDPVKIFVNDSTEVFAFNTNGSLLSSTGASLTTGGVWTDASSRTLKENIRNLSSEEALEAFEDLNPVRYNYKVDKSEEYIGFIAEDVPELVAIKNRKGLAPMDVVAVLTKVLKEQQKTISDLNARIEHLEKKSQ